MSGKNALSATERLVRAAAEVEPSPGREPWNYGWHLEEYRHSDHASLTSSQGPTTMTSEGIKEFEAAVTELLRENQVRDRWKSDEFWGVVAQLVVAASAIREGRAEFVEERVKYLRHGGRALSILLIANVTWGRPPLLLRSAAIGDANDEFLEFVNASARGRLQVNDKRAEHWLKTQVEPRLAGEKVPSPAAIACWTTGQSRLAFEETERQLRNIIDLSLLLERDLDEHKIFRRGDVNRPGIRGLALDRGAIDRNLDGSAKLELVASPFTVASVGDSRSTYWFSAEPLPLGALLGQGYLREAVRSCLKEDTISRRLRVAARWFSEAHYSLASDDAALALGIAMDALLTGQGALSGSAMADRLAMLTDDPINRPQLVTDYLELYKARSSVAHGGRSSALDKPDFIKKYQTSVHWAAWRSLALRDEFGVSSEKDIDALYNDLRWGVRSWGASARPQDEVRPAPEVESPGPPERPTD